MTTVIHHATIVTGEREPFVHFDAAIAIDISDMQAGAADDQLRYLVSQGWTAQNFYPAPA